MIAYRVEIWCDAPCCSEGYGKGIPHNDPVTLPGIALNQKRILLDLGWSEKNGKMFWPSHTARKKEQRKT